MIHLMCMTPKGLFLSTEAARCSEHDLRATASEIQWVVESYALFLTSLSLVGGSLGEHLGRRRIVMSGVAIFAAASVGCALSGDVHMLVLARGLKGSSGAWLVAGNLALIRASELNGGIR